jgi:hypothetical protein
VGAIHLVCRSPAGDRFDVVAFRGFVVAPEPMRRQPGFWWLESEHHPHLVMEDSKLLEEAIGGGQLGCWPSCVAAERWNEAADQHRWVPHSPASDGDLEDPLQRIITDPRIEAVGLPCRRADRTDLEAGQTSMPSLAARLDRGSIAVGYLFGQIARVPRSLLAAVSLAACTYYLAAVAAWLWELVDGISGPEIQHGVVLIVAAMIASWITGLFSPKLGSHDGRRLRVPAARRRERRPLLHLALDAYRAGVILQLLAFAGFFVM